MPVVTILSHLRDTVKCLRGRCYLNTKQNCQVSLLWQECVRVPAPTHARVFWLVFGFSFFFYIGHYKEVKGEGVGRKKSKVRSRSPLLVAPRQRVEKCMAVIWKERGLGVKMAGGWRGKQGLPERAAQRPECSDSRDGWPLVARSARSGQGRHLELWGHGGWGWVTFGPGSPGWRGGEPMLWWSFDAISLLWDHQRFRAFLRLMSALASGWGLGTSGSSGIEVTPYVELEISNCKCKEGENVKSYICQIHLMQLL